MRVLITNDDGIYAEGIIGLAQKFAQAGHTVTVVAPDRQKSASAHAMTMDLPLSVQQVRISDYDGMSAYAVNGTPVDCVKIGLSTLIKEKIDLVVSGINYGSNLGSDIVYSGTVNAALEASMLGYPAIAVSQSLSMKRAEQGKNLMLRFMDAAQTVLQMLQGFDVKNLEGFIYNINFPFAALTDIKGIKVCAQGICDYDQAFERRIDPFGREYYWVSGKMQHNPYNEIHETDVKWIGEDYITVTPLSWNQTASNELAETECKIESLKLQF